MTCTESTAPHFEVLAMLAFGWQDIRDPFLVPLIAELQEAGMAQWEPSGPVFLAMGISGRAALTFDGSSALADWRELGGK